MSRGRGDSTPRSLRIKKRGCQLISSCLLGADRSQSLDKGTVPTGVRQVIQMKKTGQHQKREWQGL